MDDVVVDIHIAQGIPVPGVALLVMAAVDDRQIVIPAVCLDRLPDLIGLFLGGSLVELRDVRLVGLIRGPEAVAGLR